MSPSSLPPRKRDTRTASDRIRQDRENLKRLGVGYVGGRFPSVAPLGSTAQYGDLEDDEAGDDDAEDTQAIAFCNTDQATVSAAGIVTLNLTYTPIAGSLHVRWNGIDQPPVEWTLSGQVVTFATHHLKVGDIVTAAYAYYPSDAAAPISTIIEYSVSGWRYKQVALADATNYSGVAYDDSAWSTGATKFGNGAGEGAGSATNWDADTSLWLRREFPAATDVTVTVPVEDGCDVYVNGTLIGSSGIAGIGSSHSTPPYTVTVPDELTEPGTNLLAIRANDEAGGGGDVTMVNVQVTGRLG